MRPRPILCDLALHDTLQAHPDLNDSSRDEAESIVARFLVGELSHSQAAALYTAKFKTSAPIDRLGEILSVSSDPIPPHSLFGDSSARRKTQQWTAIEDTRLLAAIHKYGTENWNLIAQFVGNGRRRSQCSQRWQRGLDPRISRSRWSPEEEALLLQLVAKHGEKSWIRVSNDLGNRSDVQCRYRFYQIQKGHPQSDDGAPEPPDPVPERSPIDPPAKPEPENAPEKPRPEQTTAEPPAEPFGLQRIGLELGTSSMSEIFWMLHS
jgi:hypothetical protein